MTSKEIEKVAEESPEWVGMQHPTIEPLWEIAYQLAVMNERPNDETTVLRKRVDELLAEFIRRWPLADPEPPKRYAVSERCSFCSKDSKLFPVVKKAPGVAICAECVEVAMQCILQAKVPTLGEHNDPSDWADATHPYRGDGPNPYFCAKCGNKKAHRIHGDTQVTGHVWYKDFNTDYSYCRRCGRSRRFIEGSPCEGNPIPPADQPQRASNSPFKDKEKK